MSLAMRVFFWSPWVPPTVPGGIASGGFIPGTEDVPGRIRSIDADVTLSNSYPVMGYGLDPHSIGMVVLDGVVVRGGNTASLGYTAVYNTNTKNLQIWQSNGTGVALAEVTGGTNLSAVTFRLSFRGE